MKVVFDTNVFISAIFWKGAPRQILKYAEDGIITLVASSETLAELFGVLARKKFQPYLQQANTTQKRVAADILELVRAAAPAERVNIIKEDPSDNIFLACALSSGAAFIISGDRHLLALKSFRNIPILTPKQFLIRFNS